MLPRLPDAVATPIGLAQLLKMSVTPGRTRTKAPSVSRPARAPMAESPPSAPPTPLREPKLEPMAAPATMSDLVRTLRANLVGFVPGKVFCGKARDAEGTQVAVDQLEDVAGRIAAPLVTDRKSVV